MSDNNTGFYSPLFSQNRLSMQPPPRTSVPLSDTVVGDGFSIRSSSPTSMYSTNSHHRQDSYESEAGHTKNNNSNDTFMDDNNSLSTVISNSLSKEHKLYHSSSIRANNNIHSVELSPTDANFPIQAYSASILTSSSLVTIPNSNDNNTLKVEPSNIPSTNNDKNDSNEKTCNVEVVPSSDFYIRGGKGGFWGDLWRMSLIKEGKPTPKFWLILIVFLALTLLIVIPVVVATLSQSSPPPPPPSPSSPSSPQPSPPIKPNNNQTIASPV